MKVSDSELANDCFAEPEIKIPNLGVKKFKNMMKENRSKYEIWDQTWSGRRNFEILKSGSQKILKKFSTVFRENLQHRLPPEEQ